MAGTFFAFSSFIMGALATLPPREGTAAMQAINLAVINPAFMTVFMGTAAASLYCVVSGLRRRGTPVAAYLLAGGLIYLVGCFGVTMAFNVPLNDALAAVKAGSTGANTLWASYLTTWTMWNHVRGAACLLAAATFFLAGRA